MDILLSASLLLHGDFSQSNALDRGPDDGQATHLRGKHVNLISALPHIAEETLDGVSRNWPKVRSSFWNIPEKA